ncbi:hypothetical protein HNY73_010034 [Argiope bruennichi]|uniref:Uncharacterized protein n=1 Tax=Argiope bruennichi TaxID=94029 RepID=A0A8T0EZQ2_ARGBR|nr:hypothetical protein HNY73_010034 [Argiope bruennichi]
MRLSDHVYLSANCISFLSHPNSYRLESRHVVLVLDVLSSDNAVDLTLHVCKLNRLRLLSIRLLFQEEYDLEANYLLKGTYTYNIIKSVTELDYISEDRVKDIKDTAQVTFFVRYLSSQGPKEELLGLLPLSGQTRGEDIAKTVQKCLEDNEIDINKIVSKATDGARSITGIHRGVTSILQKRNNKRRNSNVSLHNSSRSTLCPNISGRYNRGHELGN